jgi:hypothetical protein
MDPPERQLSYRAGPARFATGGSQCPACRLQALPAKAARLASGNGTRPAPMVTLLGPARRLRWRPCRGVEAVARAGPPDARYPAAGPDASRREQLAVIRRWRQLAACTPLEHTYESNVKGEIIRTSVRTRSAVGPPGLGCADAGPAFVLDTTAAVRGGSGRPVARAGKPGLPHRA